MTQKRKYFGKRSKSELTEFEKNSIKDLKLRFAFWHNKQLDALTFTINLLFTVSIAVAGFVIANQETNLFKGTDLCGHYSLIRTALLVLTTSATIGVLSLVTRLSDLRITKDIVRIRRRIFELCNDIKYESWEPSDKEIQISKRDNLIWWTGFLGKVTWILFCLQLGLFMLTIWMIVLNV